MPSVILFFYYRQYAHFVKSGSSFSGWKDDCRKGLPGIGGHADLLAIKPAGFLHSLQNRLGSYSARWSHSGLSTRSRSLSLSEQRRQLTWLCLENYCYFLCRFLCPLQTTSAQVITLLVNLTRQKSHQVIHNSVWKWENACKIIGT